MHAPSPPPSPHLLAHQPQRYRGILLRLPRCCNPLPLSRSRHRFDHPTCRLAHSRRCNLPRPCRLWSRALMLAHVLPVHDCQHVRSQTTPCPVRHWLASIPSSVSMAPKGRAPRFLPQLMLRLPQHLPVLALSLRDHPPSMPSLVSTVFSGRQRQKSGLDFWRAKVLAWPAAGAEQVPI